MYWHVVVSKGISCLLVFLLCWVSVYHVSVFATSGLETSMFLCLIIWIFRILEIKHHSLFLLLGFILTLTRPEGALFALVGAFFMGRRCLLQLMSLLSLYAIWKLFYYGDLLPNTFYAKGSENQWQQGLLYVGCSYRPIGRWLLYFVWLFGDFGKNMITVVLVCWYLFYILFFHVIRGRRLYVWQICTAPHSIPFIDGANGVSLSLFQ